MLYAMLLEGQGVNLWEVVLHGGTVAKAVMLPLAMFSVISWVIILQKGLLMSIPANHRAIPGRIQEMPGLASEAQATVRKFRDEPPSGPLQRRLRGTDLPVSTVAGGKAQVKSMEAVERCLQRFVVEMGPHGAAPWAFWPPLPPSAPSRASLAPSGVSSTPSEASAPPAAPTLRRWPSPSPKPWWPRPWAWWPPFPPSWPTTFSRGSSSSAI